jgi:hypothetical protein
LLGSRPYAKPVALIAAFLVSACHLHQTAQDKTLLFAAIAELALIIVLSLTIFAYFADCSFDGTHYHLPASIALANGWNPFFENTDSILINNYPHGLWRLRALFGVAPSGFDLGRVVNVLICFSSYWSFKYLVTTTVGRLTFIDRALIILAAFNPIVVAELLPNLVDGALCSLCLSLISYIMLMQKEAGKTPVLGAVATCVLLVNTKLSGLYFAFIITSGCLLAWWGLAGLSLRWIKLQSWRIVTLAAAGLLSVTLVGYRPYLTNVLDYGALVYPPVNVILNDAVPPNLLDADQLTKLAHVVFGQTGALNFGENSVLKWPFQIRFSEFTASNGIALSGGFGPFFAMIVIVTLANVVYGLLFHRRGSLHRDLLIASSIFLFACLVFHEPWLARYIPLLPVSLILFLLTFRERLPYLSVMVPVALLLLNSIPFIAKEAWSAYLNTRNINEAVDQVKKLIPNRGLRISQSKRYLDESIYLEQILRTRGFIITYSLCDNRSIVHFISIDVCDATTDLDQDAHHRRQEVDGREQDNAPLRTQ